MRASLARRLESIWYSPAHPMRHVLWPLELLYRSAFVLNRACYRWGLKHVTTLPVPVVVVGNITVGGTGKTPCVIWLANELRSRGYEVGCISRGYGGSARDWPRRVTGDSDPFEVGDEPVIIARATGCAVAVGPDRIAAARALLESARIDVLLADDGLQHHALDRTFEIAVVDGVRGLGNGACLPAGPLREGPRRLDSVDAIVVNGGRWGDESVFRARLVPEHVGQLTGPAERSLDDFRDTLVNAVAGIGHPERFFAMLEAAGLRVVRHPFSDHARLEPRDLNFPDRQPILMTEKDAVKCRAFADEGYWVVAVRLQFEGDDGCRLLQRVITAL